MARGMLGHVVWLGRGPAAGMAAAEFYTKSRTVRGNTLTKLCDFLVEWLVM